MSTIQKRDSENEIPGNTEAAPNLKRSKSSKSDAPTSEADPSAKAVERTSDFLAAWGAGRFNEGDIEAALAEFIAEDAVLDTSSGAHVGVDVYKVTEGIAGVKGFLAWLGGFDMEGVEMSHVAAPVPNEVWVRFSAAKCTSKVTGKSAPHHSLWVYTWDGDKIAKLQGITYEPANTAATLSKDDVPMPSTLQLPTFEPHHSPLEPFAEKMALWGAGEFLDAEMCRKHCAADVVDDMTESALPDVLKPQVGPEGINEWVKYMDATWEMSNVDAVPVAGLKPGCVMMRMTFDVKHKTTGKEAHGVRMYNELAYNVAGQYVYARRYYVNAPLLASIY